MGHKQEEHKMNVAEMMKRKSEDAAAEVKKLLWQAAEAADIADAALKGGLRADVVGKIEAEVTASKRAIDALKRYDLPAIKAAHDATAGAADKTAKALETAEAAHEKAAAAARDAAGLLFEAKTEFEAIASRVTGGEMPAEGLPPEIAAIVEARRHYAVFEQSEIRAKSLTIEIAQSVTRVEALTAEAARIKKTDPHLVNERMAPLFEDYTNTAKTLAKNIEAARKTVAGLKKEATAARAEYEAEKAKLPW
jgi:hypothetical protein